MKVLTGQFAVDDLNRTDLDNPMPEIVRATFSVHTCGFRIEHNDTVVIRIVTGIHNDMCVRLCRILL